MHFRLFHVCRKLPYSLFQRLRQSLNIHPLLKPEHTLRKLLVNMLRQFRIIRVGMITVIEFHDMKAAAIDIEMYIPLFKIGRDRLLDLHLRVQFFYLAPSRIADTLAMHTGRNLQYHAADVLTVTNYTVGFSTVD